MRHLSFVALVCVAGCGISDGTLLVDLEADDVTKLCEDTKDATYTCEMSGVSIDFTIDASSCGDGLGVADTCTATVGDWRACDDAFRTAMDADPCAAMDMPAECAWIADCAVGGST